MSGPRAGLVAPRGDLALIEGYHSAQVEVAVRLNTNESPVSPPAALVEQLAAVCGEIELNRYPDRGAWALRRALGALHGVDAEQVFVANGSNEVLQALCLAFGGAGRTAVTFEPSYALHAHIARVTATDVIELERDADFEIDSAALDQLGQLGHSDQLGQAGHSGAGQPHLVFVCSPNNPTGAAVAPDVVAEIEQVTTGLVVVDEAYGQFSSWSAIPWVADDRRVVVVRTFSKTWSLAALRLGYCVAPQWVVAALESVALPYHLDAFKQAAGELSLRFVDEMNDRTGWIVSERERMRAGLASLGVRTWPSDANFVLFRPPVDAREVWSGLVARSVLVRDCSSWPRLAGCLRITIGTPAENNTFLTALADVLGELVGSPEAT